MARSSSKRPDLGICGRNKLDGTPCKAFAVAIACIAWSGARIPVCGSHLARLHRKLGSGVSIEAPPPAPELGQYEAGT